VKSTPSNYRSGCYVASVRRTGSVAREELEQEQRIEETAALLVETVDSLQQCPPDRMEAAAREALIDLRSHLEGALEALEDIERDRDLTDRERDFQHAFRMLLEARGLLG
jgi:hypothetical protein